MDSSKNISCDDRVATKTDRWQRLMWLARRLIDGRKPERLLVAAHRITELPSYSWRDTDVFINAALVNARSVNDAKFASYLVEEFAVEGGLSRSSLVNLHNQRLGMCRRVGWTEGKKLSSRGIHRIRPVQPSK